MNGRLMDEKTYTFTCYKNFLDVYNQTRYAIRLSDQLMFKDFRIKDFKPVSYAYVSIIEYLYPLSAFCTSMPFEIEEMYR